MIGRIPRIAFWLLLPGLAATTACAGQEPAGSQGMTHLMMMLVIQLGVILFAARLGNLLFERLKLPGVLGELAAGVLIGPYALGQVSFPGFPLGLFPRDPGLSSFPVSPELYGLCAVAAIVLLFMVGLETDVRLLMRYTLAGTIVGLGGVVFSLVLGDLVAMAFSPMLFGRRMDFLSPPCLFLGIMSTATSVGITARVLSEQRKLDSPEGVTVLAGAVIDDVLGIITLAVGLGAIAASKGATQGVNWAHIGVIAGKAVGIWLAATVAGLLASRRISLLLKAFRDRSAIAIMALGLALVLAGLFEEAGLAMIIGAYVMGLSLSRTDINHVVREKLTPIYAFLVPVFFTVMGMLVDVRAMADRKVLIFGAVYTVVAVAAKVAGCGLPALFANFNLLGALRVGVGMIPRGEVALIVAGIGLAGGFLTPEVFGVGILMTLATTLLAPPPLVRLFRSPRSGLRRVLPREEGAQLTFSFPSVQTVELLVTKLLAVFEAEGFFVHVLSHAEQLYQLRKDSVVIGFQQQGTEITFDCPPAQVPFVNTAMYEVLAELERTVRELRKPVDRQAIGRRLQDAAGGGGGRTDLALARYLYPWAMEPRLKGQQKEAIIDELLGILNRTGAVKDMAAAKQAVWSREESMSTGMQHGIAVPHGRTDAVERLACAVGVKREGVDFGSIDGQPSRIFVLTLSPRSAAAPHVQFMATVSQALDEAGREALLACETPREMYEVLTGARPAAPRKVEVGAMAGLRAPARLMQYLRPELLTADLKGRDKAEVIVELLELVKQAGLLSRIGPVRQAVLEREAQMPTGLEHGVAIPHARTRAVKTLVCAFGVHKAGVDFGGLDGRSAHVIILTLSPLFAPVPHIQFMAMMSRMLDEGCRERLLKAGTREEIWAILTGTQATAQARAAPQG